MTSPAKSGSQQKQLSQHERLAWEMYLQLCVSIAVKTDEFILQEAFRKAEIFIDELNRRRNPELKTAEEQKANAA